MADDLKAPERIRTSACGKALVTHQPRWDGDVEYVRADLYEALERERDDLRQAVSFANTVADSAMTDMKAAEAALAAARADGWRSRQDWENFAKAILEDWPTGDLEGSVLFDLALQYGMIQEVPGGYNSDLHIDADGICPEDGDPWYEYTFRGEAGPGLYSITDMTKRIEAAEARVAELETALLWCSGSADFNEGGVARKGWQKLCAPLLAKGAET